MKERTVVSAFALLSSLGAYYYAKQYSKDTTPIVMIGGFLGALVGEIIFENTKKETKELSIKKRKELKNKTKKICQ